MANGGNIPGCYFGSKYVKIYKLDKEDAIRCIELGVITMSEQEEITSRQKVAAFHTLGCKVNQDESEAMETLFKQAGYAIGDFEEAADVYVINTCTVTHLSDRKSRQMIRRARKTNPDAVVLVTGCYAQTSSEEVAAMEDVDLVVGNNQRSHVVELVEAFEHDHQKRQLVTASRTFTDFEELPMDREIHMTRAYLKVQEGCEQFCTYCIIPYARGPLRSRSLDNTLAEAKKLEEAGFKELILTGIHLGAYGQEKGGSGLDITKLCQAILDATDHIRLRLSSLEPTEVSDELIELIAHNDRMCRHLHLPLQAGHDEVLKRMNRPYDTADYRAQLEKIRQAVPDIAISTDLMVGFPGETDDQFRSCLAFCDEMAFSGMHIFKYSPREGTPASLFPDQISAADKDQRSKKMAAVAEKNKQRFQERFLGQKVLVLAEEQGEDGAWEGHTDNYLLVRFTGEAERGELVWVELLSSSRKAMQGKRVEA